LSDERHFERSPATYDFKMVECTFCKIVNGESDAPVVFRDDVSTAFLDHRPLFPGHCLLVPNRHIETLPDLSPELTGPLFTNAQLLCAAVEEALSAEGSFVAINNRVSQSVPHLHIHVVPRRKKDGLRGFFWPRTSYRDAEEMQSIRYRIGEVFNRLKPSSQRL
jgi:histidine triad (HIT) family protein